MLPGAAEQTQRHRPAFIQLCSGGGPRAVLAAEGTTGRKALISPATDTSGGADGRNWGLLVRFYPLLSAGGFLLWSRCDLSFGFVYALADVVCSRPLISSSRQEELSLAAHGALQPGRRCHRGGTTQRWVSPSPGEDSCVLLGAVPRVTTCGQHLPFPATTACQGSGGHGQSLSSGGSSQQHCTASRWRGKTQRSSWLLWEFVVFFYE